MQIEITGITGTTIVFTFVGFALFIILLLRQVPRPPPPKGRGRKGIFDLFDRWF